MNDQKFAEFFAVMMGIFGHKWTLHYGDDPTGISARVWKDGLSELSLLQIANAIRHYKNKSITAIWPPSLPEFRGVALGIPTLAQVRYDAANKINNPFVVLTRSKLDHYAYTKADQKQADAMFKDAYELALIDIANGVSLPEPLAEIEAPKTDHKAEAQRAFAEYQQRLGVTA